MCLEANQKLWERTCVNVWPPRVRSRLRCCIKIWLKPPISSYLVNLKHSLKNLRPFADILHNMIHQKVPSLLNGVSRPVQRSSDLFFFFSNPKSWLFVESACEEKTKDNKEKIKLNRQLPHLVWIPQFFCFGVWESRAFLLKLGFLVGQVDSSYRIFLDFFLVRTVSIVVDV